MAAMDGGRDVTTQDSERRHLTVMFCDIAGFTELSSRLDLEDLRELTKTHYAGWHAVIERYEGFVARYMGEGVLAYFGYPVGHEDDAERAAHAALEIVAATRREPGGVAARVGIATGLVVVGGAIGQGFSEEQPAFGMTPNLAARLQAIAPPDSIAIAAETRRLIGSNFECEDLGRHQVKGIPEPVSVWRLARARAAPSRFAARRARGPVPTVGRGEELALLSRCWADACEGHGQVVLVSGESGIGKSHLCEAFLDRASQMPCAVLRCQCSALHAHTAFHPIIEAVERAAAISREDNATDRLSKLRRLLDEWPSHDDQTVPLFATLLSLPTRDLYPDFNLSARDIRKKIADTLVDRMVSHTEQVPMILLLEDAQWSDPSSQDLLAAAVERIKSARVLMLITARPEFEPSWMSASHVTGLALNRLERRHAVEMAKLVADATALSEDKLAGIVERADGVPLFVEEFTRWVMETGGSPLEGSQSLRAAISGRTAIPETLQDPLMSQLDKLGIAKPAAQLGAIIGRIFPYWLLCRLWPFEEETLDASLAAVVRTGLITRQQSGGEVYYVFKHELIRDAAYESLLKSKRQSLHVRIADIISDERANSSDIRPELIAYHYTAAGFGAQAAPLWLEAGQLALRESANREARASLTKGLECLAEMPESPERMRLELRLQSCLGQALIAISGHASPEVQEAFSRAHQLCLKLDEPELFSVVWGIAAHHLVKGDIDRHLELSARLLEIAETSNDSGQLVVAHASRTLSCYFSGQFISARKHLEEVRARYDWDRHRDLAYSYAVDRKMIAYQFGTWTLWKLGFPDQAAELEAELNRHARRMEHPNSLAQALTAGASVYMLRREPDRLLERVREGIAIAESHGYPVWVDHADFWLGWAWAEKGNVDDGIAHLGRALVAYQKTGAGSSMPKFLGLLADRMGEVGRCDEGLALLNQAIDHIERTGERASEAETYRLKAKLLFVRDGNDSADVEANLRKAIEIARAQEAKGWELRAATTLARLLQRRGQPGRAREYLAPVYEWFTEGLDTPDLKEAEELLRRLQ
jgi:class 3 adenylate cyclase/predicted ATPase